MMRVLLFLFIILFGVLPPTVCVVRSWRHVRRLRRDREMIERLLAEVREAHR